VSDKVQIIYWPCFLDSQMIRVFYYLKESRCGRDTSGYDIRYMMLYWGPDICLN
jgi:hypothetical protein